MDYTQLNRTGTRVGADTHDEGLRAHMLQVYNLLGSGLFLSAIIAFVAEKSGLFYTFASVPLLHMAVQFAPLILLFVLMFKMNSMSVKSMKMFYWAFVSLKGLALSYIFAVYGMGDISRALLITAVVFGTVSLYGYSTKRDLTGFGSFLMMGVWGVFLAMIGTMIFGMFGFETSGFHFILFSLMTLIVIGLTAYETQKLKQVYYQLSGEARDKVSIVITLNLYINIIIIFQYVLSFLGNRN